MPVEEVDTLVVGAGQAGVAMSEHLSLCGVPHLVLASLAGPAPGLVTNRRAGAAGSWG